MPKKKTASSAAAAAALERAGVSGTGFIGFSAFASDVNTVSDATLAAEKNSKPLKNGSVGGGPMAPSAFYTGSNHGLASSFKNISKKDKITKIKSLQEIDSELKIMKPPEVRVALAHWLYLYNRLSFENDKRTRELTAIVLAAFISRVPKAFVRNADSIMASFLCATVDPAPEVVRQTSSVFENTFPPTELAKVFERSSELILSDILKRLKPETANNGIDKKKEAIEERMERLQVTALGALSFLVRLKLETLDYKRLVSDSLWKFLSSKSGSVRVQAYKLLKDVSLNCKECLNMKVVASAICKAVGTESEIYAFRPLWEMILHVVDRKQAGDQFWSSIDPRKNFFPQLWKQLENGGGGGGDGVFANMMPFLSLIPQNVWNSYSYKVNDIEYHDGAPLMEKFLEELWKGLSSPNLGPHNAPYLIVAEMECVALLFKIMKDLKQPIGNSLDVLIKYLIIVVSYYCGENMRYRVGNTESFKRACSMALQQLDKSVINDESRENAWNSFENACLPYLQKSEASSERVAQLIVSIQSTQAASSMASRVLGELVDTGSPNIRAISIILTKYPDKISEISKEKQSALLEHIYELFNSYCNQYSLEKPNHRVEEMFNREVRSISHIAILLCGDKVELWRKVISQCIPFISFGFELSTEEDISKNMHINLLPRSMDVISILVESIKGLGFSLSECIGRSNVFSMLDMLVFVQSSNFNEGDDFRRNTRKALIRLLLEESREMFDFITNACLIRTNHVIGNLTGHKLDGVPDVMLETQESNLADIVLCVDVFDLVLEDSTALHTETLSMLHTALMITRAIASLENGNFQLVEHADKLRMRIQNDNPLFVASHSNAWLQSIITSDNETDSYALAKVWAAVAYEEKLASPLLISKDIWSKNDEEERIVEHNPNSNRFIFLCIMFITELHSEISLLGGSEVEEPDWFVWEVIKCSEWDLAPKYWKSNVLLPKVVGNKHLLVFAIENFDKSFSKSLKSLLVATSKHERFDGMIIELVWPFFLSEHAHVLSGLLSLESIAPVLSRFENGDVLRKELSNNCKTYVKLLPPEIVSKSQEKLSTFSGEESESDSEIGDDVFEANEEVNGGFAKGDRILYKKPNENIEGEFIYLFGTILDLDGSYYTVEYSDIGGSKRTAETTVEKLSPRYIRGERVKYVKDDDETDAEVVEVYQDLKEGPYYSVKLFSGKEIQTTVERLSPSRSSMNENSTSISGSGTFSSEKESDAAKKSSDPKNIEELNRMIAKARQRGDRQESIRLMRLIPVLSPKPVDTEEIKSKQLAEKREREKQALKKFNEVKGLVQSGNNDDAWSHSDSTRDNDKDLKITDDISSDEAAVSSLDRHNASVETADILLWISVLAAPWRQLEESNISFSAKEQEELMLVLASLEFLSPITTFAIYNRSIKELGENLENETRKKLKACLQVLHSVAHADVMFFQKMPPSIKTYICRMTLLSLKSDSEIALIGIRMMKGLLRKNAGAEPSRSFSLTTCFQKISSTDFPKQALGAVFELFISEDGNTSESRLEASDMLPSVPVSYIWDMNVDGSVSIIDQLFELLWLEKDDKIRAKVFLLLMSCTSNDKVIAGWYEQGSQSETGIQLPPVLLGLLISGMGTCTSPKLRLDQLGTVVATFMGWLITLKIIRRFGLLHPDTREETGIWLRGEKISDRILKESFAWLNVINDAHSKQRQVLASQIRPLYSSKKVEIPPNEALMAEQYFERKDVQSIAACVLVRTLRVLPALGRQWWADTLNRTNAASTLSFISSKITPLLVKEEVAEIQAAVAAGAFPEDEMQVFASTVSRTVTTLYKKDGCKLEMVISIPEAYPFKAITVECTKQLGVKEKRWRRWVIQIVSLLSTQDGSVLDAVNLTKQNLDKEFEGTEPCPICYCVINIQDHTMPRMECKTCHYKYHSKCIGKWFQTSKKDECPLCKQSFH